MYIPSYQFPTGSSFGFRSKWKIWDGSKKKSLKGDWDFAKKREPLKELMLKGEYQ